MVKLFYETLSTIEKLTSELKPRRVTLQTVVIKGFLRMILFMSRSAMFAQNSFQAHANRNGPFLATVGTKDLDYFGQDRAGKKSKY